VALPDLKVRLSILLKSILPLKDLSFKTPPSSEIGPSWLVILAGLCTDFTGSPYLLFLF
jgi:hypothetical protein